jgi:hypothetical protein
LSEHFNSGTVLNVETFVGNFPLTTTEKKYFFPAESEPNTLDSEPPPGVAVDIVHWVKFTD